MSCRSLKRITVPLLGLSLAFLPVACSGDDGAAGPAGPQGPAGPAAINASTASFTQLAELDVVCEVESITISSPPVVTFSMVTADGLPIVGLVPYWEANHRFVRFALAKLVEGTNGDPDSWVSYTRSDGEPTYDSGASLVDNDDGTYTFTFNTDVTAVTGVTYEPTLTHRLAGQIGQLSTVPVEEQNVWHDFVPAGGAVTTTRNIAVMESCNECHDNLVFHGRRWKVEYCVTCHNPDLAEGEGDMGFMIHRIHAAGQFHVLDGGVSYAEVTYPQGLVNCRKCHNVADTATPQADNWRNLPSMEACGGCHDVFGPNASGSHTGPAQTNNANCYLCHGPTEIAEYHTTTNATPNNPELLTGQRSITYEVLSADVDSGTGNITIQFKILSDGTALDVTNLPADLKNNATPAVAFSYPALLFAYALPQGSITAPADYNNIGRAAAQPLSLGLGTFTPIATSGTPNGTIAFDTGTGITTVVVTLAASKFPSGATMRAVALQGYLQQDIDDNGTAEAPLHTISYMVPVTGDAERREIVDSAKCANCHEWFEGHGGNRVYTVAVCVMCHVPNLSSSGRTNTSNPVGAPWPTNVMDNPEDAQNMKDMIHGIHASAIRTRDYTHVRNRGTSGVFWYDWAEVTFPAETNNCELCHLPGTYELPIADNLLATTVRTTGVADGLDLNQAAVTAARAGTALPGATDWVNTPMGSSCFYCHTSVEAWAHMTQNGAQLTHPDPAANTRVNRSALIVNYEACSVCHGAGKTADITEVHNR
jgi:OmcA/MtrC family decaheme c-type cytochrome